MIFFTLFFYAITLRIHLKNASYFDVIEGRTEVRPIPSVNIDIYDSNTYVKEEKGVDINLATHMLSKGYQNAYDVSILIDYIPAVDTLHHLGKIVVLATLPHQKVHLFCHNGSILFDSLTKLVVDFMTMFCYNYYKYHLYFVLRFNYII